MTHPNYDEFWKKRNVLPHLTDIKPAVLVVGGWFDAEDLYGPLKTYEAIETQNSNNLLISSLINQVVLKCIQPAVELRRCYRRRWIRMDVKFIF